MRLFSSILSVLHNHLSSYLLPRWTGDTGTAQLCLRDVDMDLTRIGKLSRSGSPSNSIASCSFTSSESVFSFAVSIDPNSPFRLIVKLSPTAGPEQSLLSMMQPGNNFGLS